MNLQQLKVFVLAVQLQKLYLVADKLHITQPTVTFHLNKLQEDLGVSLFQTNSYHVLRLSEAGKELYHYASHISAMAGEIEVLMEEHRQLRRARLSIGSTHTPATYMLPRLLADLKQQYPRLAMVLDVKPAPYIVDKIKQYELDLGLISGTAIDDSELISEPLLADDLVIIFHPRHPFASLSEADWLPQALLGHSYISHEEGSISRGLIEAWCSMHGIQLDMTFEVSGSEALKASVVQQLGFGIVSEASVLSDVAEGKLIRRAIPYWESRRFIFAIRHKNRLVTPAMRLFWERMQLTFTGPAGTRIHSSPDSLLQ